MIRSVAVGGGRGVGPREDKGVKSQKTDVLGKFCVPRPWTALSHYIAGSGELVPRCVGRRHPSPFAQFCLGCLGCGFAAVGSNLCGGDPVMPALPLTSTVHFEFPEALQARTLSLY